MLWLVVLPLVLLIALIGLGIWIGFFNEFPSEWEWFFGILSIVGLIVGAIVFPQLIWGKPKLKWDFHTESAENERHLGIMFSNPQVQSKVLRRLGVYRQTISSLIVQFRVAEAGSGTILLPTRQAIIKTDESIDPRDLKHRISLPPTYSVGASALIVMWDYANSRAVTVPTPPRKQEVLGPGYYRIDVVALVDGEPERQMRTFVVGTTPSELTWIKPKRP